MSSEGQPESKSKSESESEIDFDRAEYDAPTVATCVACKRALDGAPYYSVNGHLACEGCLAQLRAGQQGSFIKALGLGTAAGAIGAAIYYAIRSVTGYDLALITLVIGILVGIGVRRGAGGSQSWVYRAMAVALTWVAMCITYVPGILEDVTKDGSDVGVAQVLFATMFSLVIPYLLISGAEVLALVIFGVGIWEAWRRSAPPTLVVEGPFEPAAPAPAPAPAPTDPEPAAG
jgi:hypothetical protein